MVGPATIQRPHHGAAGPVRLGDDRFVRHFPPLIFDPNAIVAVLGFPIRIGESCAVGIRAARALAALEALEPWLERRASVAAVVARESGRGDQQRREQNPGVSASRFSAARICFNGTVELSIRLHFSVSFGTGRMNCQLSQTRLKQRSCQSPIRRSVGTIRDRRCPRRFAPRRRCRVGKLRRT
jgi:hypothetical protein